MICHVLAFQLYWFYRLSVLTMDLTPFNISHNLSLTFDVVSSNLTHTISGELAVEFSASSPYLAPLLAVGGSLLLGNENSMKQTDKDHQTKKFDYFPLF